MKGVDFMQLRVGDIVKDRNGLEAIVRSRRDNDVEIQEICIAPDGSAGFTGQILPHITRHDIEKQG